MINRFKYSASKIYSRISVSFIEIYISLDLFDDRRSSNSYRIRDCVG